MRRSARAALSATCALLAAQCIDSASAQGISPAAMCVPVSGFSPRVFHEERSRFEIESAGESFSLPDNPFQRIVSSERRGSRVRLVVETGKRAPGVADRPGPGDLADSPILTVNAPEIRRIAAGMCRDGRAVRDVQRFVCRHITNKMLGIPLISAIHVLRGRAGDCTEHTVLAVALLRAAGVPARAMVGMLLEPRFAGMENVFVYHMWAQAFVGGEWVIVDATRPDDIHPNRYIAFAGHNLRTAMPLSCLNALSAIRDLTVRYLPE